MRETSFPAPPRNRSKAWRQNSAKAHTSCTGRLAMPRHGTLEQPGSRRPPPPFEAAARQRDGGRTQSLYATVPLQDVATEATGANGVRAARKASPSTPISGSARAFPSSQ